MGLGVGRVRPSGVQHIVQGNKWHEPRAPDQSKSPVWNLGGQHENQH